MCSGISLFWFAFLWWCDVKHLLICLLAIFKSLESCLLRSLTYFLIELFSYCCVLTVLCIFWIRLFYQKGLLCVLLLCGLSSHYLHIVFCRQEIFNLNEIQLFYYSLMNYTFGVISEKASPHPNSSRFFPKTILGVYSFVFSFRSMIHVLI